MAGGSAKSENLGPDYQHRIHFIGHSSWVQCINAYAARRFFVPRHSV